MPWPQQQGYPDRYPAVRPGSRGRSPLGMDRGVGSIRDQEYGSGYNRGSRSDYYQEEEESEGNYYHGNAGNGNASYGRQSPPFREETRVREREDIQPNFPPAEVPVPSSAPATFEYHHGLAEEEDVPPVIPRFRLCLFY